MSGRFDIAMRQGTDWFVNGECVDEQVAQYLNDEESSTSTGSCPHCDCALVADPFVDIQDHNDTWHLNRQYEFVQCTNCGYWRFDGHEAGNRCMDPLIPAVPWKEVFTRPELDHIGKDVQRHFWGQRVMANSP